MSHQVGHGSFPIPVTRSCFTRIATAWLSQGDAQRSALWFSRMVDAGAERKGDPWWMGERGDNIWGRQRNYEK